MRLPLPSLFGLARVEALAPPRKRFGARVFGIDVTLDASWFLIVLLLMLSLSSRLTLAHPGLSPVARWASAGVASALFFLSILAHELAHSLVARFRGIRVEEITLFVFGGVSRMKDESRRPADEVQIAGVGPVTSVGLALLFSGLSVLLPDASIGRSVARWLGMTNLMLAVFNLLPGFPLDGGRILRAVVWDLTGNLEKATRAASSAGIGVAALMILGGAALAFHPQGDFLSGLWTACVGGFLWSASATARRQFRLGEILGRLKVEQAMRPASAEVPPDESVRWFVEERLLKTGERCYLVPDGPGIRGLVTVHQVKGIPRAEWDRTLVKEIMVPLRHVQAVSPAASLKEALEKMESAAVDQLPVLEGPSLRGMLTREDALHRAALQIELGR